MKILVAEDNQRCIEATYYQVSTDRSKHVDVNYQLVVHHVSKVNIEVQYVPSDPMMKDIFMKKLKRFKFVELMKLSRLK